MHEGEIGAFGPALFDKPLVVELHQVMVLGMDGHQAAPARDLFHRQLHAAVIEHERQALGMGRQNLGGEDLEGRKAIADRVPDLIENPERQRAAQRQVKRVVDVGPALPSLGAARERGRDIGCGMHEAEIDVRGGTAERHPDRVLFGAEREQAPLRTHTDEAGEMSVRLDSARDNYFTAGVNDAAGLGPRIRQSHRDDFLALYGDVPLADSLRSDDLASTKDQIIHGIPRDRIMSAAPVSGELAMDVWTRSVLAREVGNLATLDGENRT